MTCVESRQAISSTKPVLSRNDRLVLGALFDHEGSASNTAPINTNTASLPGIPDKLLQVLQQRETRAILPLNTEGPTSEEISTAVRELSFVIDEYPEYASAWNNRAQAVRMLVGDDLTEAAAASSTLYNDLCQACHLASPTPSSPDVSPLQAKILASAHTHRAHLLLKCSRSVVEANEKRLHLPRALKALDAETLERMAARDFQLGGKYGNSIAKQMAVQLNPYAKLCGEIVKEAMIKDMREMMQSSAMFSHGAD